jgi:S1-C subfamily serine protease
MDSVTRKCGRARKPKDGYYDGGSGNSDSDNDSHNDSDSDCDAGAGADADMDAFVRLLRARDALAQREVRHAMRRVGRLTSLVARHSVTEPWRLEPEGEGAARATCWFLRLPCAPLHAGDGAPLLAMTCAHCIFGMLPECGVFIETPVTGEARFGGRVVAVMPDIDAALIEVRPREPAQVALLRRLRAWDLGDDKLLVPGSSLRIYGYPLGQQHLKVSASFLTGHENDRLQLDGSINPGESGAAVIWRDRVVGWISAGIPEANAVTFAKPISMFRAALAAVDLCPHLRHTDDAPVAEAGAGTGAPPCAARPPQIVRTRSLGIDWQKTSRDLLRMAEVPCASGVLVSWVSARSPLAAPEVRAAPGDVLCALDIPIIVTTGAASEQARQSGPHGGGAHAAPEHVAEVSLAVDSDGSVTVPWSSSRMSIDAALSYVPAGMPVTVHLWKQPPAREMVVAQVPLRDVRAHALFEPWPPWERPRYVVFGGVVFVEANAAVVDALQCRLSAMDRPALVVTCVYHGSPFAVANVDGESNIGAGSVLHKANGQRVHDVATLERALLRPVRDRFVCLVSHDGVHDVVDVGAILATERFLAQQYGYPISHVFLALERAWHERERRTPGAPTAGADGDKDKDKDEDEDKGQAPAAGGNGSGRGRSN